MNSTEKVVFVIVPHPDDFEILVGPGIWYFISQNYKIYEILMTGGEYGILNRFKSEGNRIKGYKLQSIRKKENQKAKSFYGKTPTGIARVSIIPINYIDGFLPFNKKSVHKIQQLILQYSPSVIIAPDPVYSIDFHQDHMNTARIVYFAVKYLPIFQKPKNYYLFQTFRPNFFLPIYDEGWNPLTKSLLAHRSQLSPFNVKMLIFLMHKIVAKLRRNRFGLRKINLTDFSKCTFSFKERLFLARFQHIKPNKNTYYPLPDELGLNVDPK